MAETRVSLPIDVHLPEIVSRLKENNNLVLIASPGAGKTTRVPIAILDANILGESATGVLMLEPRRLAARAAASRMAQERGCSLGREIGYQVRFDNRTSAETRLCVITEGLLSRRLARDPQLSGIGCVILDEFHERSWHTDLGLGLLRELQQLARPDLKVVVMSATLNAEGIARYLDNAPIVDVNAAAHPIQIHMERQPQLLATGPSFVERVGSAIVEVLTGERESHGDVLVFLPGAREITNVATFIEAQAQSSRSEIHTLHGSLKLEDQDRAIRRSDRRKLILATNIAETSLTIDGVGTVVDSGLARVVRLDTTGFPRLELSRISRFSAIQRAGRAGRQGPGVCHRLWNKLDEASMAEAETPEIHRVELAEAVLLLIELGITDPNSFDWFDRPSAANLDTAIKLLWRLQAIDLPRASVACITPLGRRLLDWPLHPRLARIMEAARSQKELISTAAKLCALISEKDILQDARRLKSASDLESDLLLRLEALEGRLPIAIDRGAAAQVRRAAEQIEHVALAKREPALISAKFNVKHPERELLLLGYPDRVARRRRPGEPEARLVGGKGLRIGRDSCVERSELFIAIDAANLGTPNGKHEMTATLASGIDREWLKLRFPDRMSEVRKPALDKKSGKVLMQIYEAYEDLPIEEPRLTEAKKEEVAQLLPLLIAEDWDALVERNEGAANWLARFEFLRSACPEKAWPKIDFKNSDEPAIQGIIEALCFGETSPTHVAAKDWIWHFETLLGSELNSFLRAQAPEAITVPTGNRMKVHYPPGRAPYLEVRIQEVFGCKQSPKLAEGRVSVVMHLLGPNFRPVQVTSDLSSFWVSGYNEVRKELRARYPKHSWPEDPLSAPPQAKGGPRRS